MAQPLTSPRSIVHHYLCYVEPARAKVLLQPLRAHKAHLGHQVAVLSKGDYFGDLALFAEDSKRTATVSGVAGAGAAPVACALRSHRFARDRSWLAPPRKTLS